MNIQLPVIKKAYPQLTANSIVSVQPLLAPTGLVYYLRYRYSSHHQEEEQQQEVPKRKKRVWRDITEPWEPTIED